MKLHALVLITFTFLTSCSERPDTPMRIGSPISSSSRVNVTRIGVIEDSLAYDSRRGIYLIEDTKTGKEYIGVSGIGISELGQHQAGKTIISDER